MYRNGTLMVIDLAEYYHNMTFGSCQDVEKGK